jgi:hypothetical protein
LECQWPKTTETELLNLFIEKYIDVELITKTNCKPNTKLYFPSFSKFINPDKTANAGSAIIISSKIQHQLISCIQINNFQLSTILYKQIIILYKQICCLPPPNFISEHCPEFY